jgi:hypothetical protein
MNKNSQTISLLPEKWMAVYQAIPDDGSPIRYKQIVRILNEFDTDSLHKISRSTISAALTFFCNTGYIKKEKISKKNIEYSRQEKLSKRGRELWNRLSDEPKMEGLKLLESEDILINPAYCHDLLVHLKKQGLQDNFMVAQSISLFLDLKDLHIILLEMLLDYADNLNKTNRDIEFQLSFQLEYLPRLIRLTKLIDDVGFDDKVMAGLIKTQFGFTKLTIEEIEEIIKKRGK